MNHDCACGRPIQDTALVCITCGMDLDAAIADVCAYRGLAYDLDVALSRQSRLNSRDGSRPTEAAVAFDARAGRAAATLKRVVTFWANFVAAQTGAGTMPTHGPICRSCQHRSCRDIRTRGLPGKTTTGAAVWLRPRVGWLRYHDDGPRAFEEILDAVHSARRICDRPADRLYAGPCDCGEDMYARLDASFVVCRSDAHEQPVAWEVEARRRWLLTSAADVLATATEISRALTRYAQPVTPSALRGYVFRKQLVSRGERQEGHRMVALYRLGDVLDILQRQAERVSA